MPACPPVLLDLIGIDMIFSNVPPAYLKSMWATQLSSRFLYTVGLHHAESALIDWITSLLFGGTAPGVPA